MVCIMKQDDKKPIMKIHGKISVTLYKNRKGETFGEAWIYTITRGGTNEKLSQDRCKTPDFYDLGFILSKISERFGCLNCTEEISHHLL